MGKPTPSMRRGSKRTGVKRASDEISTEDYATFWNARPILTEIRTYAQAYRVSPWGTLGAVLARAISIAPPPVVLPAGFGGSEASLNLFIALVGRSGAGKGGAENVANSFLQIEPEPDTAMIGSGEGVSKLFAYKRNSKEFGPEQINIRNTVLFSVPEIDALTALGDRTGATLVQQLRMAWSGERLGFAYADPNKSVRVERHRYRMSLVLGVQPLRAGPLLDDASGGTPQRFIWLPTWDEHCPAVAPPPPAPRRLPSWPARNGKVIEDAVALLDEKVIDGELEPLTIPAVARDFLDEHRRKALASEGDEDDAFTAHAPLSRLKIAAALMVLDGRRNSISTSDWRLAGIIEKVSNLTRARIEEKLREEEQRDNVRRGANRGVQNVKARDVEDAAGMDRVAKNVCDKLAGYGELSVRELTKKINPRDRNRLDEVFDTLLEAGTIQTRIKRVPGGKSRLIKLTE